jgi:quercetin dioxygenase-like cupin family protein
MLLAIFSRILAVSCGRRAGSGAPLNKFKIKNKPNKNMKTKTETKLTSAAASRRDLDKRTTVVLLDSQPGGKHTVSRPGHQTFLALFACAAIGVSGVILAGHAEKGHVKVTHLSQRDIIEKLDGKNATATVKEVTFKPGQKDSPHRHAGPVFGYVLEGEYEHAINEEPVKVYKAGETFYEPSGCVHRVAQNPSGTTRTRLLAE